MTTSKQAQQALWDAEDGLQKAIAKVRKNKTFDDSNTDLIAIEAAQRRVHMANAAYLAAVKKEEEKYLKA